MLLVTAVLAGPGATPVVATVRPASRRSEASGDISLAATPTLAELVGQKLMVAMSGTSPSPDLLGRIGRGEVGGVILFGENITTARALRDLTRQLAHAAAAGGRPPLLIATDQEGGSIKRLAWAPPTRSPASLGDLGSASVAKEQGTTTGYVLRCAGIYDDLAPVADLPGSTASFMYQQGRTWSFDASVSATLSDAFASGLEAGGDVPAMKHFPGIGLATQNTDDHVVTITASRSTLAPGLLAYQKAIGHGIPMIMLSNATYTAYDSVNGAGWSRAIGVDLLRTTLGFNGVSITDSLSGTAAARGVSATSLARRAAQAGTDMLMLTGSEASTKATYASLLKDAQAGTIPRAALQASYDRILALKSTIKGPVADATPPSTTAPRTRLYAPSTLGATTAPVRTSWTASDPCGISSYTLKRQVAGGSWSVRALAASTATSLKESVLLGSTFRYALKATDGAGNRSTASFGPILAPVVRQSSSSYVTYTGAWSTVEGSTYSGGSTRYASARDASASYTFTGSGVAWVAAVGPTRGSAKVYLDGTYKTTVSLYATAASLRRVVYADDWTSQGSHRIRIVVAGTAGHPRVDVDAFVRLYRP